MNKNNYDLPQTPVTNNFRRVTTDLYFTPDITDGKTGDIRLGNCTMSALKHGNTEVEVMRAYKGGLSRAASSTSEVKPEVDITLNEYIPNLVAVLLFGTLGAPLVQAAATAQTLALASVNVGMSYRIGKRALSSVVVTSGASAMQPNLDYQIDLDKGYITIIDGGGIADGTALSISYSCAAVTLTTVQPYSRLNRTGFLRYYAEDQQDPNPREETYVRVQLSPSEYAGGDPKKYDESKIKCLFLAQPTMYLR